MTIRSTETRVVFQRPFLLKPLTGSQPAGEYRVTTDEESVPDVSFLAFRRTATLFHTPALAAAGGEVRVFTIEPADLQAALAADSRP